MTVLDQETRRTLRRLVDQRARQLADDLQPRCKGCGADHDAHTHGCRQCGDRHRERARRKAGTAWGQRRC